MTAANLTMDDLYVLSVIRDEQDTQTLLRVISGKEYRAVLEKEQLLTPLAFQYALTQKSDKQRKEFERLLRALYDQLGEEEFLWFKEHLRNFETDPAVREEFRERMHTALARPEEENARQ